MRIQRQWHMESHTTEDLMAPSICFSRICAAWKALLWPQQVPRRKQRILDRSCFVEKINDSSHFVLRLNKNKTMFVFRNGLWRSVHKQLQWCVGSSKGSSQLSKATSKSCYTCPDLRTIHPEWPLDPLVCTCVPLSSSQWFWCVCVCVCVCVFDNV